MLPVRHRISPGAPRGTLWGDAGAADGVRPIPLRAESCRAAVAWEEVAGQAESPAVPPRAPRRRTHATAGNAGSSAGAGVSPEGAWCRRARLPGGRTYGTILVGVETSQVVDVLPDYTSEPCGAWLREHLGAEMICSGFTESPPPPPIRRGAGWRAPAYRPRT